MTKIQNLKPSRSFEKKTPNFLTGFTLLEVIVAIFVLLVGVMASLSAIQKTFTDTTASASRLVAAYLTQEGIEIVRNIRDTNLLQGIGWNSGLANGDWEADYNDSSLVSYGGINLKIDANGFYNYDFGDNTKFKRKINIISGLDIIKVTVQVEWSERGASYFLSAQENLYNWR